MRAQKRGDPENAAIDSTADHSGLAALKSWARVPRKAREVIYLAYVNKAVHGILEANSKPVCQECSAKCEIDPHIRLFLQHCLFDSWYDKLAV